MENFLSDINVDRRVHDITHADGVDDPDEAKPRKRRKIMGRGRLRSQILGRCNVVLATLSGAGSKGFIDAVCRDPTRNDSEFDAVIVDEACQASEPESLIPFKYNPTTVALVGDPHQLPVLTLSGSRAGNRLFERSLFERLHSLNHPAILLRTQYRMAEDIAAFPSEEFYGGKLITPEEVLCRRSPRWVSNPCFPTVCFWDVRGKNAANCRSNNSNVFTNVEEADFIIFTLLKTFAHTYLTRSDKVLSIGIISFYSDQVKRMHIS